MSAERRTFFATSFLALIGVVYLIGFLYALATLFSSNLNHPLVDCQNYKNMKSPVSKEKT
jgi:hypothetical protein